MTDLTHSQLAVCIAGVAILQSTLACLYACCLHRRVGRLRASRLAEPLTAP